jgi:CHAT domain-containing protein/tetratricopeptide (TPR) repeat protein
MAKDTNKSQWQTAFMVLAVFFLMLATQTVQAQEAATQEEKNKATVSTVLDEALALYKKGKAESTQEAIKKLLEIIPLCEKINDEALKSKVFNELGAYHNSINQHEKAIEHLNRALSIRQAINDKKGLASTLNNLGVAYDGLGKKRNAIDYYQQALVLRRETGDRKGEAVTLNNLGNAYSALGEYQKAFESFLQSIPIRREVGDTKGEIASLVNLGMAYNKAEEKQLALEALNQALSVAKKSGDKDYESSALNNLGFVYSSLGEKRTAIEYYKQALEIRHELGLKNAEGSTLINIGANYVDLGEMQKAIEYLTRAVTLKHEANDRGGKAIALNNLASAFESVGAPQIALDYYNQSLTIRRELKDRRGEASVLNNLGALYERIGDLQKAVDYYNQALPLRRAAKDTSGEASTLNNMSSAYLDLGDKQKALELATQALELQRKVGDKRGEGRALYQTGLVYQRMGDIQNALNFYNQALELMRYTLDRRAEAKTVYQLALLEQARNNFSEATKLVRQSLTIAESVRNNIGSQSMRQSYFAAVQNSYELLVDLLIQQHKQTGSNSFLEEAFQTNESARARSLLEMLNESKADIRQGVDANLLKRERELQNQLNAKSDKLMNLLKDENAKEQIEALRGEIDSIQTKLQAIEVEIKSASPRYAALTKPAPLKLKDVQSEVLDADTALLEYALGSTRSYVFVVTNNSISAIELPKRAEIEKAVRDVNELLKARNKTIKFETVEEKQERVAKADQELPEAMATLSNMITNTATNSLNKKRLLIVPDGILQYVPFAALSTNNGQRTTDNGQPLTINHEIVTLPSASSLAVLRRELKDRKPAPKTLAVLADPVFDTSDERFKTLSAKNQNYKVEFVATNKTRSADDFTDLTRSANEAGLSDEDSRGGFRLSRLPFTRKEADSISSLVNEKDRKEALDFAANRENALNPELSQYRIIHFATHGFVSSTHPELSGIVLSLVNEKGESQNGFLRARDAYNLKLPAELVVLSGCQTGLGKEIRGEGIVGLTRGFMYAGAARVAVSLWDVNDEATSELMIRFYRGMLKDKLSPSAALRQAQVSMMKDKRWSSPYYWASFVLQGEPR